MSVILYGNDKFRSIAASLKFMKKETNIEAVFDYPGGWQEKSVIHYHIEVLVNDLQRANVLAWNAQYPDDIAEYTPIQFRETDMPYKNGVALFKSLHGLRYNLYDNGGKDYDMFDAIKRLDRILDSLAFHIIAMLPEWERANTW